MSNVVYLNVPGPKERGAARTGALVRAFARHRRGPEDVFWLKENAELLNILENTGQDLPEMWMEPYAAFYANAGEKLAFFPQYYRFILSLTLDLEALGMAGDQAESLCALAVRQDLAGYETSDIQRLEAFRLMQRRGFDPLQDKGAAEARLRDFISRPERFALPNKKAAFELTHIVFYLSEYGRKSPELGQNELRALENAGILAFLDGNLDLLAEVCVAMRYAGHNPSGIWEDWVAQKMNEIEVTDMGEGTPQQIPMADCYHEFLTSSWLAGTRDETLFVQVPPHGKTAALGFQRPNARRGALREISVQLYRMGDERRDVWGAMRNRIDAALTDPARHRLAQAEASTRQFDAFFEDFARARRISA
ncbi:hypothetical protein Q4577_16220 [Marinovum sp. 2_MG-2023]|uniref:DUF6902 family protein n=1 Tax=unclassified Marinovum TaxID=2647166 RepID=UPI0026E33E43|nr:MULTISPECIES: hypothetical protein [unclassified Marinovum]MDO6731581.1 hypothetical protein [Marinovum sp. 2_MG-2023]MDO6778293.1 hypothetical protein [Marinovum sp. 1_MG-2023]